MLTTMAGDTFHIFTPPTAEAFRALETLQQRIWNFVGGYEPAETLQTAAHYGGVVLAVYQTPEDILNPIAFAFGFLGRDAQGLKLCSHMVGVHPDFRDRRMGQNLKFAQAAQAYQQGIARMTWTFDPLEVRNAYLNLHKLGGYADQYYPNLYGTMPGLSSDLPSDRLLVTWDFASIAAHLPTLVKHPEDIGHGAPPTFDEHRLALMDYDGMPISLDVPLDGAPVWLELPHAMQTLRRYNLELAQTWRYALRHAMTRAMQQGYIVQDVLFDKGSRRIFYLLCQL